jgi:hypothetical protein
MRQVTEEKEIRELLANREFMMYNKMNNHAGELTTLNDYDISMIIRDMNLIYEPLRAKMETDGAIVRVIYPKSVCTLESVNSEG